jgi:hypothetical protein
MTKDCPSNFALDAFRLGFENGPADHVKACPHCAAWLAAQDQLDPEVASLWIPAETPSPRIATDLLRRLLWLAAPVAIGAAVLLLVVLPKQPTETAKGGAVSVEIARLSTGILSWLSPTDRLMPNDSLRFFVHRSDSEDRYALIGSVDGRQQLARFYPADASGCSIALPAAADAIDGSIVIDDAAGPERIVVLVSHRPLCWPAVGDAARRFALGEPLAGDLLAQDIHAARLVFAKQAEADH